LRGAFGELCALVDVRGEQGPQLQDFGGERGRRLAVVVAGQRLLERLAGLGDVTEVGGAACLEVFADRPIVGDEALQHGICALGERLAFALHPPDGFRGLARGLGGEPMAHENDQGDGGQPDGEPASDTQSGLQASPGAAWPLRGSRQRRGRWRRLGESVLHMT